LLGVDEALDLLVEGYTRGDEDRGHDEQANDLLGAEGAHKVRLRGGRLLLSPTLVADGKHARADGDVSLAVVASAVAVAAGFERADPMIGLLITLVILKITRDWRVISTTEPSC